MRLAAFVVALTVIAPAAGNTDSIGLAMFTVTEDGSTRVVMNTPTSKIYCSRYMQCNGDPCTPVPVTAITYQSNATGPFDFLVQVIIADVTTAGTTLAARPMGTTPAAGFANVHVSTMAGSFGWQLQSAGTVEVLENEYGRSPFRAVVVLHGITDGTNVLDGSIECPDVFVPTNTGGGGCGGSGGGGGGGGIDD